jgi:catechol 2,3-dioxygenase-like lactoylglutathione lyase family enzyme
MIKGLAHVCFVVKDLEVAMAFYRDKLGCTPAFDFRKENGERFGWYMHLGGRNFLELFTGTRAADAPDQSYRHLCFEVENLEAEVARLRAAGVEVTPVNMGADHSWQAWITDPDGNQIELHQYTPESWQTPWAK